MTELISISYLDDDVTERNLAERAKSHIEGLGHICVLAPSYLDAYGGDGSSPIIDFPRGRSLQGIAEVTAVLEQESLSNFLN